WGVEQAAPGLRCYPHKVRGEGFFMAAIRKQGEARPLAAPPRASPAVEASATPFGAWLQDPGNWAITTHEEVDWAIQWRWAGLVGALAAVLPVLAPGTPVARRKGSAQVPHPALALNAILHPEAFPVVEVDRAGALRYLHGE